MPKVFRESSGLALGHDLIWTINDSGDGPYLYAMDAHGKLQRKVILSNAKNNDRESLAQDENYLYIGDIGNNRNRRSDFTIYRISWAALVAPEGRKEWRVEADRITFSYANRTGNEPRKAHNFDAEGLAVYGDELWLFSKNRADYKTQLYRLPTRPGHYQIQPSATYDTGLLITAADIDPQTNRLVLLGYHPKQGNFATLAPVSTDGVDWQKARRYMITPSDQWEASVWHRQNQGQLLLSHEKMNTRSAGLALIAALP